MRVAGYCRVSTDTQADEGYSLAAQEAAIRRWCADQGHAEPVIRIDAGVSAYTDDIAERPAFAALMADIADRRFDILVVTQLDRFARSNFVAVQQLSALYDHGCALVSLAEGRDFSTAEGRFRFQLMASFAEYDSSRKSERVIAAIAQKRLRGGHHGGLPWGTMRDHTGALVIDPARAEGLRRILELAAERGALSVAAHLTAAGVPTRRGHAVWQPSAVASFMRSGDWLLEQPEPWPTLYRAARSRPKLPRAPKGRGVNLLTGLLRCACGGTIVYSSCRRDDGERHLECRNYSKERPRGLSCPYRGKATAPYYEALVERWLFALPDLREIPEDPAVAEARIRLGERRAIAQELYFENMDRDAYLARRAALDAEEAALPLPMPLGAALARDVKLCQSLWAGMDVAERNAALRRLIARVVIERRCATIEPVRPLAAMLAAHGR